MKRFISKVLILCLLLTSLPLNIPVFAADDIAKRYPGFERLSTNYNIYKYNFTTKKYEQKTVNLQNVVREADAVKTPLKNRKDMYLSAVVLARYDLAVYNVEGSYLTSTGFGSQSVYNVGSDKVIEYRYLGYNFQGESVSNDLHQNDLGYADPSKLKNKNWIEVDTNRSSWTKADDSKVMNQLLKTPFVSDDGSQTPNPEKLTIASILNPALSKYGIVPFTDADDMTWEQRSAVMPFVQVQAIPSIATKGSVALRHKYLSKSDSQWHTAYNTFILDELTVTYKPKLNIIAYLDVECTQPITQVEIPEADESKMVYVKVNADISLSDLGIGGKESVFIDSVTNSFNGTKGTIIKSFPYPRDVYSVFPLTFKRKDFGAKFKKVNLNGLSRINPKSDILNITKDLTATGSIQVRAIEKPHFVTKTPEAAFKIMKDTVDYTNDNYYVKTTSIKDDIEFNLVDQCVAPLGVSIAGYSWAVENRETGDFDFISNDKNPNFLLKANQVDTYAPDGKANILLKITAFNQDAPDQPIQLSDANSVTLVTNPIKPDPVPAKPKVYLDAAYMVRAGEETFLNTTIDGNGTSITDISYSIPSSVKVISSTDTKKAITYLDYGSADPIESSVTITSNLGTTDTDNAGSYVKHPLEAVMKTNGAYKINRTIELDSTSSTGTTYYPIDQVTWTIRPMDGQSDSNIKYHTNNKGAKIKVDFKALGRYEVWMNIHSTCTYPGESSRSASAVQYGIITIQPDLPPVAMVSAPGKSIRDPQNFKRTAFYVSDLSYSPDGDEIGNRTFFMRFDSDNDKSMADEEWQTLYAGNASEVLVETGLIGSYEFRVAVEETNDSTSSPFWSPYDVLRDDSSHHSGQDRFTDVLNVGPITSVAADRRSVDYIFVTDYEGTNLSNLKSDIDLFTKNMYEMGININVKIVSGKVPIGMTKLPLYNFSRLGHATVDYWWRGADPAGTRSKTTSNDPWETRIQPLNDYLPNYGSTIPTDYYSTIEIRDIPGESYNKDQVYYIQASTDPYLKSKRYPYMLMWGNRGGAGVGEVYSFSFTLDGYFTNLGLYSYGDSTLYGLNFDAVKNLPLRQGADKKLVVVTNNSSATLNLNTAFKDWCTTNHIEVSSVGLSNVKDVLGYGNFVGAKFVGKKAVVVTTDQKESFVIGNLENTATTDIVYPMKTSDSADTTPGMKFQFVNSTAPVKRIGDLPNLNYETLNPVYETSSWAGLSSGNLDDPYGAPDIKENLLYYQYSYDKSLNLHRKMVRYNGGTEEVVTPDAILLKNVSGFQVQGGYTNTRYWVYGISPSTGRYTWLKLEARHDYNQVSTTYKREVRYEDYPTQYFGGSIWIKYLTVTEEYMDSRPIKVLSLNVPGENSEYNPYFDSAIYKRADGTYYMETAYGNGYSYLHDLSGSSGQSVRDRWVVATAELGKIDSGYFVDSGGLNSRRIYYFSPDNKKVMNIPMDFRTTNHPSSVISQSWTCNEPIRSLVCNIDSDNYYWATASMIVTESGKVLGYGASDGGRFGRKNGGGNGDSIIQESRTVTNSSPETVYNLIQMTSGGSVYSDFPSFKATQTAAYGGSSYQTSLTRLLGETLTYDLLYADYEGDNLYSSKIKIEHDPTVLENTLGKDPNDGKTVSQWDGKLLKPGLYTVNPSVQDSPNEDDRFAEYRLWNKDDMTLKVLVHRKPFAVPKFSLAGNTATTMKLIAKDNGSLDLDHESLANKGIAEVEWAFKAIYDPTWQKIKGALGSNMVKIVSNGEKYIVSYRVKDLEGEWSDPVTQWVEAKSQLLLGGVLKSEASPSLDSLSPGAALTLEQVWTSYDKPHRLTAELLEGSQTLVTFKNLDLVPQNLATQEPPDYYWKDIGLQLPKAGLQEKAYAIRLTATDTATPTISVSKTFNIGVVLNRPPTIELQSIAPSPIYSGDDVLIGLLPKDPDNDRLEVQLECTQKDKLPVQSRSGLMANESLTLEAFKNLKAGTYPMKATVKDSKGATGECFFDIKVLPLDVEDLQVTGSWQYYNGQKNLLGHWKPKQVNRFMSYEALTISARVTGDPDEVTLRLSPELERMVFKSSSGRTYAYKDELGYEVKFPLKLVKKQERYVAQYILPLAPSTISETNQRLRPPYYLELTVKKGGKVKTVRWDGSSPGTGIDLTGNVMEKVYVQPARR